MATYNVNSAGPVFVGPANVLKLIVNANGIPVGRNSRFEMHDAADAQSVNPANRIWGWDNENPFSPHSYPNTIFGGPPLAAVKAGFYVTAIPAGASLTVETV